MALLPLETLEVRILSGANFVFLRIGQHRFLRNLLRIKMHVLVALLKLLGRLRVHGFVVGLAWDHVIIILLYLLIAHYLVQFHLTVGKLAGVHLLVLSVPAHLRDLVHIHVRPFLAVHVIILSLALGPRCLVSIIIMILELIELRLRLVIRIIVQRMQIVRAHLLHVRRVTPLELASMCHSHVFEYLLLGDGDVPAHGTRSILVHLLHLGRTRALVAHHFLVVMVL